MAYNIGLLHFSVPCGSVCAYACPCEVLDMLRLKKKKKRKQFRKIKCYKFVFKGRFFSLSIFRECIQYSLKSEYHCFLYLKAGILTLRTVFRLDFHFNFTQVLFQIILSIFTSVPFSYICIYIFRNKTFLLLETVFVKYW